jgi:adenylosuccinate synthase
MSLPTVIIGAQWGDEGKGKIVDYLASKADIVVRFNGGNNAGHTVVLNKKKYPLSLLPSGVLWKKHLLISQGVVINPQILIKEIEYFTSIKAKPILSIDFRTNIVMPYHQWLDQATEESKGEKKVGSLKLGIGYCYEDRNNRHGIRLSDLIIPKVFKEKLAEEYALKKKRLEGVYGFKVPLTFLQIYNEYIKYGKKLKIYLADVSRIISENIKSKKILFEGAHGTFLDGNFGTYPYTTAVNTISGSVFPYVGFPPQELNIVGVVKAYTTRVGGGPFPAELFDNTGNYLQEKGGEFGTVSKRKRRCGWLDLPMLRLSHRLNGYSYLAITKLDVLTGLKKLKIVTEYMLEGKKISEFPLSLSDLANVRPIYKEFNGWDEDISKIKKYRKLPKNSLVYLSFLEKSLKVRIKYISVAAERNALIINN